MVETLLELKRGLIHLLYPNLCEGCRKPLVGQEHVLCLACAAEMPETGYNNIPGNETEMRFAGRIPYKHAASLAYFTNEGLLQHFMHGLKYKNQKQIGYYLGEQLGKSLMETNWINEIDCIVPVPLHPAKEAARGYNQSLLIAEGMSKITEIPVLTGILSRNRQTESQTKKTRSERVENMKDAFSVLDWSFIKNKHILLCDDVLTTGATLEACGLALLMEESVKISIATIGIAVS